MNWYLGLLAGIIKVRFKGKSVPLMCHWEITYSCNLKCNFCVTRFDDKVWYPETDTSQAIDILSQVANMGSKILNLVGGEPTMRDDLPQIIRHAHSLGMKVSVTTNGVIKDERRHWLLDVDVVRVSLEGTPALNNYLRQSGRGIDSSSEAIETLRFLRRHGKRPSITSIYSTKTQNEDIEFLVKLAKGLKIQVVFYPLGIGFSDRREDFTAEVREERKKMFSDMLPLQVSLKQIALIKRRYPDCVQLGEPCYTVLKGGGLEKFGCLAMNTAICIKPDGSIAMPCIEFPHRVVKSSDLSKVFYGEESKRARRKQGKYWFCERCQLRCMILSTSLVRPVPIFQIAREYLPQVFNW